MSNLFKLGLVGSAVTASVTVYGVYRLGKTAYVINNAKHNYPTPNKDYELEYQDETEGENIHCKAQYTAEYRYYAETAISDKIIFIPKQFTEHAIYRNKIAERFESTQQLFYYLRRRSNMEAIHRDLRVFRFKEREILIFCTDLHSQTTFEALYIIGRRNDKTASNNYKKRIEKWKMSEFFLSSHQITRKYGIAACDLPSGSSLHLMDTFNVKMNVERVLNIKNTISIDKYCGLKCIKTKLNSNKAFMPYIISKYKLMNAIASANILRPIISFSEDKSTYYIDMVLLVDIGNNNWIGIIFRDYNNDKYIPIDLAIDCYDIRNKMALFNPPNNKKEYMEMNKYTNSICGVNIVDEDNDNDEYSNDNGYINIQYLERKLLEANQRINKLQDTIKQQQEVIDEQYQDNDVLKQVNNYYFQQCLDPNSVIKPHSLHLEASRSPPITISIYQQQYTQ